MIFFPVYEKLRKSILMLKCLCNMYNLYRYLSIQTQIQINNQSKLQNQQYKKFKTFIREFINKKSVQKMDDSEYSFNESNDYNQQEREEVAKQQQEAKQEWNNQTLGQQRQGERKRYNQNGPYQKFGSSRRYNIGSQGRQRSDSPVATREELALKRIQLIVYVGNLPISWNQEEIRKFFENWGPILDVKLMKKNQRFMGSALVKFKSLTDAEQAIISLKGQVIEGAERPVNIKWLDTEQQGLALGQNDDHKLFVGSLPRQATRETLYEVFSILGEIETIRLQDTQYWAFVDFKKKQSALLAIKFLNEQTYLHGSRIPIQVRFKQRKYNSFMSKKHAAEDLDPFAYSIKNVYHEVNNGGQHYYYNYATGTSQYDPPPPGAKIFFSNNPNDWYIQQEVNTLNDMQNSQRKLGPPGSNLFLFHLPNNMKDSELHQLFKKFGNILSTRVMTEKNGKSKGIGFVSFEDPKSAQDAIEEMNGFEVRGKRLKVELNKKDEQAKSHQISSLSQAKFDIY